MILEIKKYPNSVLRKKCQDVGRVGEEERILAHNMLSIMCENNGVGLAAPQVGVLKKVVVIDVGQGPVILFNPRIVNKSGKIKSEEGCLSIPDVVLSVNRAQKVEVKALDQNNKEIDIRANGYFSCALQHEIDHLSGILILDKANIWEKLKNKSVFNKLIK